MLKFLRESLTVTTLSCPERVMSLKSTVCPDNLLRAHNTSRGCHCDDLTYEHLSCERWENCSTPQSTILPPFHINFSLSLKNYTRTPKRKLHSHTLPLMAWDHVFWVHYNDVWQTIAWSYHRHRNSWNSVEWYCFKAKCIVRCKDFTYLHKLTPLYSPSVLSPSKLLINSIFLSRYW